MRNVSHRQKNNLQKIKKIIYSDLNEAIQILKETATVKFSETVELHANLNIDPKYSDQQLRATVTLPNGTGKIIKIAVLTSSDNVDEVKLLGADIAGSVDLIQQISQGNINFDLLISTPEMMPQLAKLGRVLGPKGLMPSPKSGTVTTNLKDTLLEFKKGKFEYKTDKTGIVHVNFGKANFTENELTENLVALYKSIEQNRPSGVKGKFFKSLFICNTMGPSIKLDLTAIPDYIGKNEMVSNSNI